MKILLVEDNVSLCRNIASVLQNEGYTVVTCSNGNEAEFQMLNNSSDLILLDRMLPGKDGITLTREARTAGITAVSYTHLDVYKRQWSSSVMNS